MVKYQYLIEDDTIKEIFVTTTKYRLKIPAERVPFSKKQEIERYLNALFEMGVKIELATLEPLENSKYVVAQEEARKIEEFIRGLSSSGKKVFLVLDRDWKAKSEVDRALGFEGNPQKLAGVLSGVTKRAKSVGLISGDNQEELIERIYEGNEPKYRLTELGLKVKQKLQT